MAKGKRGNKILGAVLNVTPKRLKPTMKKAIKRIPSQVESGKNMVGDRFNTIMYGKKYKKRGKKR